MLGLVSAVVLRRNIALTLATAVLATAVVLIPTIASAQDESEEDSAAQVAFVSSLLTAEDLSYLSPLQPQQRRELLEVELSLLVDDRNLNLSAEEESAVIDSWLALVASHEPRAEYTPVSTKNRSGARGSVGPRSSGGSRPSTDTGYLSCSSVYIDSIGISYDRIGGYDTIHLDPSTTGIWFANGSQMYNAMVSCFKRELHVFPHVRNWDSIYQQLVCHMVGHYVGAGPTWDLEGHRRSHFWWFLDALFHRCDW